MEFIFKSICLILAVMVGLTHESGIIKLHFSSFTNSKGRGANNNKCDGISPDYLYLTKCDYQFTISLENYREKIQSFKSKVYNDQDNVDFDNSLGNKIQNPMVIKWQNFKEKPFLRVNVMDIDLFNAHDDVVEYFVPLEFYGKSEKPVLQSSGGKELYFTYQMICDANLYGPSCSAFCRENNRYYCDENTGSKICRFGWLDPSNNCETKDFCAHNPCHNGGNCSNTPYSFHCSCPSHATGRTCEKWESECTYEKPCMNGAVCKIKGTPPRDSYFCECLKNFTGRQCEHPKCPHKCFNGGSCVMLQNKHVKCNCADGYTGISCSIPILESIDNSILDNITQNNNSSLEHRDKLLSRILHWGSNKRRFVLILAGLIIAVFAATMLLFCAITSLFCNKKEKSSGHIITKYLSKIYQIVKYTTVDEDVKFKTKGLTNSAYAEEDKEPKSIYIVPTNIEYPDDCKVNNLTKEQTDRTSTQSLSDEDNSSNKSADQSSINKPEVCHDFRSSNIPTVNNFNIKDFVSRNPSHGSLVYDKLMFTNSQMERPSIDLEEDDFQFESKGLDKKSLITLTCRDEDIQ